jgi:hypothetical protein
MAARGVPDELTGAATIAAALVVLAAAPRSGFAAVRVCEQPVSSGIVAAPNEKEAHTAALAAWRAQAFQYGEPYASWRLAAGKLLKCLPRPGHGFECLARASPCTIEQAPNRRELRRKRIGV